MSLGFNLVNHVTGEVLLFSQKLPHRFYVKSIPLRIDAVSTGVVLGHDDYSIVSAIQINEVPENNNQTGISEVYNFDTNQVETTLLFEKQTITDDHVRNECKKRMIVFFNARDENHLSQLINEATQQAVGLLDIGESNWTPAESAKASYLRQSRAVAAAFDLSSKSLRSGDSIPEDYKSNKYWP